MTNKNTTKKTRKARKNFPLIKFICTIFFFVGTILFVINAVTDYKTYTNSEIVKANVHVHNKNETFDFVIPDCVSATTNGYSEIVTGFNLMASDPEYFKKFHHLKWLNTAFMYAANSRFKYVCAYKTYKRTKNELAKEYLIDYQKMAADAIALELAEKDFVDFLRLEFINLGYDEDIVKCLEEQNWNVALAYMLNEEKEKDSTGNTFVI